MTLLTNNEKKVSLKKVISNFNFVMVGIIIIMIVFFAYTNMKTLTTMGDITMRNQEMLQVYSNIDDAHLMMRSYIQDSDDQNLLAYNEKIDKSKTLVKKFQDHGYSSWRYALLENMIDSYSKDAMNLVDSNSSDFQENYEHYSRSYDTLKSTSIEYFSLLVKDMEEESELALSDLKVSISLGLLSIGLLIIWLFLMSHSMLKWFLNPIKSIMSNVDKIRDNDFSIEPLAIKSIELEELSESVIDMAGKIEANIAMALEITELEQQILEEKNIFLESQEMSAKASLKAIQHQVNPHFLFNTLNVIYKLTLNNDAKGAQQLIERLSQLLRYSLDYSNELSTLSYEINAMNNYIYIQEQRFQDRIQFEVDIADNYSNIEIPGYIIIPLLENAIEYGFKEMTEACVIDIDIRDRDNVLTLVISDNGSGMDAAKVDAIFTNDYQVFDRDYDLTLYTMMQRLKVHFEERVNISINTCEDCGFEIVIEIEVD